MEVKEVAIAQTAQTLDLHRDRHAAGEQETHTTGDAKHAQRGDKGRHIEPRHEQAVDQTGDETGKDTDQGAHKHNQPKGRTWRHTGHCQGRDNRYHAHDIPCGQIDAGRDDDKGLAKGKDGQDRHIGQDILEVGQA